jgi:hypothetical protein
MCDTATIPECSGGGLMLLASLIWTSSIFCFRKVLKRKIIFKFRKIGLPSSSGKTEGKAVVLLDPVDRDIPDLWITGRSRFYLKMKEDLFFETW